MSLPVEVHSMDEVAVEHTSRSLRQTQTGRVRTPGPPTSFSLSLLLPAAVRLPWNYSSLVTPCDPDIPCQVPWVYHSESVLAYCRTHLICDLYPYRRRMAVQSIFHGIFTLLEKFAGCGVFAVFSMECCYSASARGVFGPIGIKSSVVRGWRVLAPLDSIRRH